MTNRYPFAHACVAVALCAGCGQADPAASGAESIEPRAEALTTATMYSISAVQPLAGQANTYAYAINDAGTVTGLSAANLSSVGTAIRVAAGGKTQDLGGLKSGLNSVGLAINAAGQVAGSCNVSSVNFHGCLYTDGKGWIDLGVLNVGKEDPTTQPSGAAGVNTSGKVVGTAPWLDPVSFSQFNHAFTYAAGKKTDLLTLIGADGNSSGAAINDNGLVAGSSTSTTGSVHAALWSGSSSTDLGMLPGATTSAATALNASGHVVGSAGRPNCHGYQCSPAGFTHAFLYTPSGGLLDLGTLGGVVSNALGVDAADEVVGSSTASGTTVPNPNHKDPNRLAFLYAGGTMVDLNTRIDATGWVLREATGINGKGQIVGNGTLNGVQLGFVLTLK